MVSKILDHLYLGDIHDAGKFNGEVICVMQEIVEQLEPDEAYWIPIIRSSAPLNSDELILDQEPIITVMKHQIDLIMFIIDKNVGFEVDTLIHCMAGIERSPLVVASYLHKYRNMTWDEAYDFIKEKRPEVANRLQWLNMTYDERMS